MDLWVTTVIAVVCCGSEFVLSVFSCCLCCSCLYLLWLILLWLSVPVVTVFY